jgi:hypothetical protein
MMHVPCSTIPTRRIADNSCEPFRRFRAHIDSLDKPVKVDGNWNHWGPNRAFYRSTAAFIPYPWLAGVKCTNLALVLETFSFAYVWIIGITPRQYIGIKVNIINFSYPDGPLVGDTFLQSLVRGTYGDTSWFAALINSPHGGSLLLIHVPTADVTILPVSGEARSPIPDEFFEPFIWISVLG